MTLMAFPAPYTVGPNDDLYPAEPGMTLRDYAAIKAMAGLLASNAMYGGKTDDRVSLARDAYATADALLAERERK